MSVRATIVDEIRSEAGMIPGAIEYREREGRVWGLAFRCPCGCGEPSYMPVRLVNEAESGRDQWIWNGDRAAPVLSPSVLQQGLPCKWHGYLGASDGSRPGEWVEC